MKPRHLLAIILVGALVLLSAGIASAATTNSFGRTYSGINDTTDFTANSCNATGGGCHSDDAAGWTVGTPGPFVTDPNAHSSMVTSIPGNLGALEPTSGATNMWPAPGLDNGLRFNPSNVQFEVGGEGFTKEWVGVPGSVLPTASGPDYSGTATMAAAATNGLGNEYPLIDGTSYDPVTGEWLLEAKVSLVPYFQRCGSCHNVGVTKPNYPGQGAKDLPDHGLHRPIGDADGVAVRSLHPV